MRNMKRMLSLLLILLLGAAPALAEDVCIVENAASASGVTTGAPYLRLLCPLEEAAHVTLSIRDAWGTPVYQRDYGLCEGSFRSRDVYLPLEGDGCSYTVSLKIGGEEHSFTVVRELPMMTDSAVYAGGLSLAEMTGGSSSKYAAVLDLNAMNGGTLTAPMLSGGKQIGEVYLTVLDGTVTASACLTVPGMIDKANVYIATDAITAKTLGTSRFTGTKTRLDRAIRLGDAPYAAVMVQLTATYDPAAAEPYFMDREAQATYEELLENWQLMQLTTANEAVG